MLHPSSNPALLLAHWRHLLAAHAPPSIAAVFGVLLAGLVTARVVRARRNRALARGARLIEISAPPEAERSGGETLWANLLGLHRPMLTRWLRGQEHVAFEYAATGEGLSIRMWIPAQVAPGLVEQAVEAAWPGARTTILDTGPAPIRADQVAVEGGRLVPARSAAVPLRVKFDTDPLRPLLGALAALGHCEAGCVQILARPASPRRVRKLRRSLAELSGRPRTGSFSLGRILAELGPGPVPNRTAYNSGGTPWRDARTDADARAAAGKLAGPLWEAEIRYAAASPLTANGTVRARGVAHQIASAMNAFAERNHLRRRRLTRPAETLAGRGFGRGALYSVAELAALAHLPTDQVVPGLARAGARPVPPSIQIPQAAAGSAPVKVLGDADAGPARPIALPVADARHHLHVVGATGVGKSTLLANLVLADVTAGRGAVVIDPKGDLVADLLDRLPADIAARTVLFDPEDTAPPPRINMFDGADPDVAVDNLTGIFKRIYAGFWGPRTDDLLRAACLTLITACRNDTSLGTPTLADIPELLISDQRRAQYLAALRPGGAAAQDFSVLDGFWAWYQQLSVPARGHVTAPLLNKLRAFLLRDFAAQTVATGATSIDLQAVLDGGLCLVRLPKGVLGDETVRLLGSFVVAKCWQAAAARARLGLPRRDASLVIDECHNFLTLPIGLEEMLAEARAYRLSLTLAHQNLAQMPPDLREGVSANARNKLIFSVSPEDARTLERHTLPSLGAHDLSHLGAFQAAARLTVGSAEQPACTLATRPLPDPIPGRAVAIRAAIAARPATQAVQISP
jgi:Type IV secretion-system coupling protein DNA-binding domain